ncbi:MAG: prephenate dehydrogenase [Clostridia bacterium]
MNIGIIGLGLIGGSIGKAITGLNKHTVYGDDLDNNVVLKAQLVNAIDYKLTENDYQKLDMLIIGTYPRAFGSIVDKIAPKLLDGTIILDIAGIKRSIVADMEKAKKAYPKLNFIATHPMAGKEFSGIEHSSVNLFNNASMLMINVHCDMDTLTTAKDLFEAVGFTKIVLTTPDEHDKIIAFTSQLAHIISSSYIKSEQAILHDGFSAGSFRDLTRVAKLNPTMWTELFMDNSDNLLNELNSLISNLNKYKTALENKDEDTLFALLEEGNEKKIYIEAKTRSWKRS